MNIKRIMSDLRRLRESPLKGIYVQPDESSLNHIRAMIIGPKDTSYYGGFFLFDIRIPEEYPMVPPKVEYLTNAYEFEFNPNLYTDGTVCLSILNTWDGPQWTPCQTIGAVLLAIQALVFNDAPLRNEPGYEDVDQSAIDNYNTMIEHETVRTAIFRMWKHTPRGFEGFLPQMEEEFVAHYPELVATVQKRQAEGNRTIRAYGMSLYTGYTELNRVLVNMRRRILFPTALPKFDKWRRKELQEVAETLCIPLKKKSPATGRMIWKIRAELIADIVPEKMNLKIKLD